MCIVYYRASMGGFMEDFNAPALSASPYFDQATFSTKKVTVRKNFPETWLWEMIDAG